MADHRINSLWRRIGLSSLALNLFLIAVIGGHMLQIHNQMNDLGTEKPLQRALANAEAALSPADATVFAGVMRRDAPQYVDAAQQLAQAREQLEAQIAAQPFDPQVARQALKVWQADWNQFIEAAGGPLVDALSQISPDGRRRIVNWRKQISVFSLPK